MQPMPPRPLIVRPPVAHRVSVQLRQPMRVQVTQNRIPLMAAAAQEAGLHPAPVIALPAEPLTPAAAWWAWPRPITLATYERVYAAATTAVIASPAMRTATWQEWAVVVALIFALYTPGRAYFVAEPPPAA